MKPSPYISEQLLELIETGTTDRISICAMLSISLPTLKTRLADHKYKPWMIDRLTSRLRLVKPVCLHEFQLNGEYLLCLHCNEPK
jgi:hypothetical protein